MTSSTNILVNPRQQPNDLLKSLTHYTIQPGIEPDFVIGRTACALYLSLKYHEGNRNYIYDRINKLKEHYDLRILLVVNDFIEHKYPLKELSKLSIMSNMTLMLCWSVEDAAMYLKKYKILEKRPADEIMEKPTNYEYEDALEQYMIDALAECRSISRTNATSIVALFDTFEKISSSSVDELAICPGLGQQKAQNLYDLLHNKMKR